MSDRTRSDSRGATQALCHGYDSCLPGVVKIVAGTDGRVQLCLVPGRE